MHKPVRDLQINFEPPSDFVGDSSSSGGRPWLKWMGIGCAGISLIIGLIMVFGGFKMVSCCSDLVETGKMTLAVEEFSQGFARAVQNQEFESAYAMTNAEKYQANTSLDAFTTQFAGHETLLARSMPVVSNVQVLGTNKEEGPNWDITMRLLPPDGDQILTMVLGIGGSAGASKEAPPTFEIYSVLVESRKRDISAEAPAVAATEFQNLLRRGDYEAAYKQFGSEQQTDDAGTMSEESFKTFVKENEAVLTREIAEVVRVEYANSDEAKVALRVAAAGDQPPAVVTYKMVRSSMYGGWRVLEMSPQFQEGEMPDAVEVNTDEQEQEPDQARE